MEAFHSLQDVACLNLRQVWEPKPQRNAMKDINDMIWYQRSSLLPKWSLHLRGCCRDWTGMNQPSKDILSPFFLSLLPLIPGLGRSPGIGNDNSIQYSYLKNSMDRGAWWVTAHGVPKSWTWLSDWAYLGNKMDTQRGERKWSLINGNKSRDWDWHIPTTIIK